MTQVTYPAAEKVVVQVLRDAGLRAHVVPPRTVTAPYVRVARVGGIESNRVTDSALVTLAAYGKDPVAASEVISTARAALRSARATRVGDAWVRWWTEASGPALYPDPDTTLHRYQMTGQIHIATNTG